MSVVAPEYIRAALDHAVQRGILEVVGEGEYKLSEIGMTNAYHHGLELGRTLQAAATEGLAEIVKKITECDSNGQA